MSNSRSKKSPLSKTCISYLEDRVKEKHYHRRKILKTWPIQKWIECENEAVFVLNKALNKNYEKSKYSKGDKMENERCTGHEDIDDKENFTTIDTKVCATFDTFPLLKSEIDKLYWRQWQAYMWLKWEEYKKHIVAKVLVNSPARQIKNKLYQAHNRLVYKYAETPEYVDEEFEEESKQIFLQHVFDQQLEVFSNWQTLKLTDDQVVPFKERVRIFEVERDDEAIEQIKKRVEECREYLVGMWY